VFVDGTDGALLLYVGTCTAAMMRATQHEQRECTSPARLSYEAGEGGGGGGGKKHLDHRCLHGTGCADVLRRYGDEDGGDTWTTQMRDKRTQGEYALSRLLLPPAPLTPSTSDDHDDDHNDHNRNRDHDRDHDD
jgi:hypothetical protein